MFLPAGLDSYTVAGRMRPKTGGLSLSSTTSKFSAMAVSAMDPSLNFASPVSC